MNLNRLLVPAILLFAFTALSHAQSGSASFSAGLPISYEHDDSASLTCNVGGEKLEIFKIAQKYMNTDKSFVVQRCCQAHKNYCKLHTTIEGNSLAHLAAYAGDTALLEKLITEEGFPNEQWQVIIYKGTIRNRTQLMYSAEQGHLKTVKMLVLDLRASCATKNEDGKTAEMLAKENGKTDVVNFLKANCGGGYTGKANTANKQSVVLAAQEIAEDKNPPEVPYKELI